MNHLYFTCHTCKEYIDAGYRWAYWTLEHPGVVTRGMPVSVAAISEAVEYWSPGSEAEAKWLRDLLPRVRTFLDLHNQHGILFEDSQYLPLPGFDWLDRSPHPDYSPRYLVEEAGLLHWEQVLEFMDAAEHKPWWWECHYEDTHEQAHKVFEALAAKAGIGSPTPAATDGAP